MKRNSRFDELITVLFMLLAVGAVVCYFALGKDNPTFLILGGLAILLRIAQYVKRFL